MRNGKLKYLLFCTITQCAKISRNCYLQSPYLMPMPLHLFLWRMLPIAYRILTSRVDSKSIFHFFYLQLNFHGISISTSDPLIIVTSEFYCDFSTAEWFISWNGVFFLQIFCEIGNIISMHVLHRPQNLVK